MDCATHYMNGRVLERESVVEQFTYTSWTSTRCKKPIVVTQTKIRHFDSRRHCADSPLQSPETWIRGLCSQGWMKFKVRTRVYTLYLPIDFFSLWRSFLSSIRDFLICGYQWMLVVVMVAVHCALTFALPVPGCPTGQFRIWILVYTRQWRWTTALALFSNQFFRYGKYVP